MTVLMYNYMKIFVCNNDSSRCMMRWANSSIFECVYEIFLINYLPNLSTSLRKRMVFDSVLSGIGRSSRSAWNNISKQETFRVVLILKNICTISVANNFLLLVLSSSSLSRNRLFNRVCNKNLVPFQKFISNHIYFWLKLLT